jgi:hypothetical protein
MFFDIPGERIQEPRASRDDADILTSIDRCSEVDITMRDILYNPVDEHPEAHKK